MVHAASRRRFLQAVPVFCAASALLVKGPGLARTAAAAAADAGAGDSFPAQDPFRVKEMVGASHGNLDRVRELLAESPALAKAAWDWGFGDWETALGAASHTGRRDIAELLMGSGARPDLFTFAMLGQVDVVRACVTAQPGIQRTPGPHGLTLLHHARQGGEEAQVVVDYLESVGDADEKPVSAPLAAEAIGACTGIYAFTADTDRSIEVTEKNGVLWLKRAPDGTGRSLIHLGERRFHPVGAPAVRIAFVGAGPTAAELHFSDGPASRVARRRP